MSEPKRQYAAQPYCCSLPSGLGESTYIPGTALPLTRAASGEANACYLALNRTVFRADVSACFPQTVENGGGSGGEQKTGGLEPYAVLKQGTCKLAGNSETKGNKESDNDNGSSACITLAPYHSHRSSVQAVDCLETKDGVVCASVDLYGNVAVSVGGGTVCTFPTHTRAPQSTSSGGNSSTAPSWEQLVGGKATAFPGFRDISIVPGAQGIVVADRMNSCIIHIPDIERASSTSTSTSTTSGSSSNNKDIDNNGGAFKRIPTSCPGLLGQIDSLNLSSTSNSVSLVGAVGGNQCYLWDVRMASNKACLGSISPSQEPLICLAASKDHRIATGGASKHVYIYDCRKISVPVKKLNAKSANNNGNKNILLYDASKTRSSMSAWRPQRDIPRVMKYEVVWLQFPCDSDDDCVLAIGMDQALNAVPLARDKRKTTDIITPRPELGSHGGVMTTKQTFRPSKQWAGACVVGNGNAGGSSCKSERVQSSGKNVWFPNRFVGFSTAMQVYTIGSWASH